MAKNVESFWALVDTRMEELNIYSFRELSRLAGLSPTTISSARSDNRLPSSQVIQKMAAALRVSEVELWAATEDKKIVRKNELQGVELRIFEALQGTSEEFKKRLLPLIEWEAAREKGRYLK